MRTAPERAASAATCFHARAARPSAKMRNPTQRSRGPPTESSRRRRAPSWGNRPSASLEGHDLAHHRQGPAPRHRATALGQVDGAGLALGAVAGHDQSPGRSRNEEPARGRSPSRPGRRAPGTARRAGSPDRPPARPRAAATDGRHTARARNGLPKSVARITWPKMPTRTATSSWTRPSLSAGRKSVPLGRQPARYCAASKLSATLCSLRAPDVIPRPSVSWTRLSASFVSRLP